LTSLCVIYSFVAITAALCTYHVLTLNSDAKQNKCV